MKTLNLTLLVFGLMITSAAFSFTTLNLPIDGIYKTPVDKVMVFHHQDIIADAMISERNDKSVPNMEDTIVIDLKEVVITEGFAQRTHACLQKQVKYPEFALKQKLEGVVAVTLLFNRDGNLEIVDSFGSDPRLESYVHEKLYGLHLRNCEVELNKPYNARFIFRLF
jgi:hypothetical protein